MKHAYTTKLTEEIDRCRASVRGRNGLADQSHLSPSRLEDIIAGDKPTENEHRAIVRALPRMKYHQALLLEWLRAPAPVAPPPPLPGAATAPAPRPSLPLPAKLSAPVVPLMLQPRTFGEWLRAAREREGWSVDDLASLLDLSPAAVRFWESDTSAPVLDNYERLLSALPVLAAPEVPRPASRDIAVPTGRTVQEEPDPAVPASAPIPSAPNSGLGRREPLIAFGMALGRGLALLSAGKGSVGVVVSLLRDGACAGLSAEQIADAIEGDG